jgi:hypothetical protein
MQEGLIRSLNVRVTIRFVRGFPNTPFNPKTNMV